MLDNLLQELLSLSPSNVFEIGHLKIWLKKNHKFYEECKWSSGFEKEHTNSFVNCTNKKEFQYLYESLNDIVQLHKFEKFAEEELAIYKSINLNKSEVRNWIIKNEQFASEDLACFFTDYLDYSDNQEAIINLLVYRNSERKTDVFLDINEIQHLVNYKTLFDELYYSKKLYSEGIERIIPS
ncbi:hypothetical protein [Kaistella antarctica]|uniref:Uncharacterized protein n=1 Tax=Kaistella antarctica TaxID=266748 RepID=A0A448NSU1_9FLAO|nr:hypothetical protein [Kaistella antarctica]KEY17956.1 hypothetical protein HY04_05355 [Kaistella antarctica]SEV81610.1 hypothetical protein SAMN05421765_0271 [Kaistella antarctica]VEI00382.1 Uncharacterised protein [Kaistella antarctica]